MPDKMNETPTHIRIFGAALIFALLLWGYGPAGPGLQQATAAEDGRVRLLEDGDYFPAFMKAVDGAKSEIVLSFFLFKTDGTPTGYTDRLLAGLLRAAKRGVRVRITLERGKGAKDSQVDTSNRETAARLRQEGIDVVFDSPRVTTHTKVAVIDERYIFLGSHKLTNSALGYNNELSVFIDSPSLAGETLIYIDSLHK
ncbi:MAG: phospholipase [Gemmatimonadales bacterium]|nr:MAG: phospholipase [Gemmatimonadales bacterium]